MKTTQQIVDETLEAFANLTADDFWEACDGCYIGIKANKGIFDVCGFKTMVTNLIDSEPGGNEFNYEFGAIGVELIQANLDDLAKYYLVELNKLSCRHGNYDEEVLAVLTNMKQSIENIIGE